MHLGHTTGDCRPVEVDTDIWTQVADHGPGNQTSGGVIANRSILYRLHGPDGAFLVVLNALWVEGPDAPAIRAIKALAEETGAPVRFVLTPGSMHNLNLPTYAEAFPEARVCIPRGRIPRVHPELLLHDNVELYPVDAPPPELADAGLQVMVFRGMCEGPTSARFQKMSGNLGYRCESAEPQVFLHVPTGTITNGGHHMWYQHDDRPLMQMSSASRFMMEKLMGVRFDIEPGSLWIEENGAFAIADRDLVQASARRILGWTFDKMIDIHAPPGALVTEGAYAIWEKALGPVERGEWDQVAWKLAPPSRDDDMARITNTIELEGTPELFWDAMFDYDTPWPGLDATVEELAPGLTHRRGLGSFRALRIGDKPPLLEEVVEFEPRRSMSYRIYAGGPYRYYRGRMTLSQRGDKVRMDYEARVVPKVPGTMWLLRLMFWAMSRRMSSLFQGLIDERRKRLAAPSTSVAHPA